MNSAMLGDTVKATNSLFVFLVHMQSDANKFDLIKKMIVEEEKLMVIKAYG